MARPLRIVTFVLVCTCSFCGARAQLYGLYQGCISVNGSAVLGGLVQSTDGGYGVAGWWSSGGLNFVDFELIKLDAEGSYTWGEHLDAGGIEYATCVVATPDGGFAIGGYSTTTAQNILVVKLDTTGGVEWATEVASGSHEYAFAIAMTNDGGYAVTGVLNHALGANNAYVAKLNGQGQLQWAREYNLGPTATAEAHAITEAQNGDLLVTGFILDLTNKAFVLRLTDTGDVVWGRYVPNGGFYGVANIGAHDAVVVGDMFGGVGAMDAYAMRLDTAGNLVWSTFVGETTNEEALAVAVTPDSGVVLAGDCELAGMVRPYLAKLDHDGTLEWTRVISPNHTGRARSVQVTTDGGLVAGSSEVFPGSILLARLDAEGMPCDYCGVDEIGVWDHGLSAYAFTDITSAAVGAGNSITFAAIPIGTVLPICEVLGVPEAGKSQERATLSPVPAHDAVQVTLPQAWLREGALTLTLVDAVGRTVRTRIARSTTETFDLHGCVPGLYHILVSSTAGSLDRLRCVVE